VTTSAGNPERLVKLLKKRGICVLHVVPNSQAARKAELAGVDVVIAEGGESGGTLSPNDVSTLALVPMIVDCVKIPVVAAGGISDGRGFVAMLMMGAEGVQMGTRFIASLECIAHPRYKNVIVEARETDTLKIYPGPAPVRVLRTPFSDRLDRGKNPSVSEEEVRKALGSARLSFLEGDLNQGPLLSGQGCGIIQEISPVKVIVEDIINQAAKIMKTIHFDFIDSDGS
jgi:enoyl-[acyl-carrier protein] reductase II